MLGLINIDTNKLYRTENGADIMKDSDKKKADLYTIAKNQVYNETDPLKREIMISRLASGITDFSNL